MTKLLILDKDNTLTTTASGKTFVQHPEDQVLLPGVAEAIARYAAKGWTMAIASNQGGVAAGYKTLGSAIDEMNECLHLIKEVIGLEALLKINSGVICPDNGKTAYLCSVAKRSNKPARHLHEEYPDLIGLFRKPQPGMLLALKRWLNVPENPFTEFLMVGDRPEDEQAAKAAGVEFMWAHEWRGNHE